MKFKEVNYQEKIDSLKKFTTKQERNALLVDDNESIFKILEELTDIKAVNEEEAEYLLFKLRDISVSDTFNLIVHCEHCAAINDVTVETTNFLDENTLEFKGVTIPFGFYNSVEDLLSDEEIDKLTWAEYGDLENILLEGNFKTKPHKIPCRKCKGDMTIIIDIRELFSKSSIKRIYQEYTDISMYSNNGFNDIDSMYPYEREVMASLITQNLQKQEEALG
jgi:hypothetical protein